MTPFGKEFYRAMAIGFLIGCAGMALSVNGLTSHAHAAAFAHAHIAAR
jgi:hypothetical protein